MSIKDRVGRCYELSYKEMRRGAWDHLAQGYLHYQGACIHHAWLERGGAAYDPVFDAEFPKEAYYGLFRAEDVILYTPKQACEQALKTRSAGPWTEVDDSRLKLLSSDRDRQGGFTRSGPSKSVKLTAI